jgi:hypothetical protein
MARLPRLGGMSRIHSCAYSTTPRAARSRVARSARCTPDSITLRRPGAAKTLPTVEPKAGNTLRITELRTCQIPERLTDAVSSSVRRSTVIWSVKGEICSRSAPGACTTDMKRLENSLRDST